MASNPMTVAEALLERLTDWGVRGTFGLPGSGINDRIEVLRTCQQPIRLIQVRYEEAATISSNDVGK